MKIIFKIVSIVFIFAVFSSHSYGKYQDFTFDKNKIKKVGLVLAKAYVGLDPNIGGHTFIRFSYEDHWTNYDVITGFALINKPASFESIRLLNAIFGMSYPVLFEVQRIGDIYRYYSNNNLDQFLYTYEILLTKEERDLFVDKLNGIKDLISINNTYEIIGNNCNTILVDHLFNHFLSDEDKISGLDRTIPYRLPEKLLEIGKVTTPIMYKSPQYLLSEIFKLINLHERSLIADSLEEDLLGTIGDKSDKVRERTYIKLLEDVYSEVRKNELFNSLFLERFTEIIRFEDHEMKRKLLTFF